MTVSESEEITREFLARMPRLAADRARANRTRQRCRARLGKQRLGRAWARVGLALARSVARPVAAAAFSVFCVLYVGALVATAVLLQAPFG
jgi:hypothetical protein